MAFRLSRRHAEAVSNAIEIRALRKSFGRTRAPAALAFTAVGVAALRRRDIG
jgi:hypothetical protein